MLDKPDSDKEIADMAAKSSHRKSLIIQAAKWVAMFMELLIAELLSRGATEERIYSLSSVKSKRLVRRIADLFEAAIKELEFTPPPGTRIEMVELDVRLDEPWADMISHNCPQTSPDSDVHKVGDLYPPIGQGTKSVKVLLLIYDRSWDSQEAVDWAKTQTGLKPLPPRVCFALAGVQPALTVRLGKDPMAVISLDDRNFEGYRRVCDCWLYGAEREASLNFFAYGWYSGYVAGFLCEE